MGANSITMYRGDTNTITVYVTNADGTAFNLTGYEMYCTVKKKSSESDVNAKIGPLQGVIGAPTTGLGVIEISSENSDLPPYTYVYDVEIKNTVAEKTYTPIKDDFIILDDVTKGSS